MSRTREYERALEAMQYPQLEYRQFQYGEAVTGTAAIIAAVGPTVAAIVGGIAGGRSKRKQQEAALAQQKELALAQQQAQMQLAMQVQQEQARQKAMMPIYILGGLAVVGAVAAFASAKSQGSKEEGPKLQRPQDIVDVPLDWD